MLETCYNEIWDILRPYQQEGVQKLLAGRHFLNFDDMGLGKTVQTLTATIKRINVGDKVIIFCPNKALYVWQDEINKWCHMDSLIYAGTPKQRTKLRDQIAEYTFIITTYGMAAELSTLPWDGLIADEIHEAGLLNHKTKTYGIFEKLCKKLSWFYLLTGTPVRQGVIDLYAPLHLVAPEVFKSYWQFVNTHCIVMETPFGKSIERNPKNIAEFRKILDNYMVRRLKSEVLKDLPGKQRQPIPLQMTKVQEKAHKDILEEFIYVDDDALVISPNAMTAMLKARQLLVTPRLLGIDDDGAALEYIAEEGKMLLDNNRPFVVFTPFRSAIPIIEDVIASKCPGTKIYKLMGGLKPTEFAHQWQGFMEDKNNRKVLLCTIKSGASFHATCAADVFFLGYEWDFNYNTQAEDRCCRLGQTNFVHCNYLLHKGTVDENVREKLNSKQDASNWIIGTEEQYRMMLQRVRHKV